MKTVNYLDKFRINYENLDVVCNGKALDFDSEIMGENGKKVSYTHWIDRRPMFLCFDGKEWTGEYRIGLPSMLEYLK